MMTERIEARMVTSIKKKGMDSDMMKLKRDRQRISIHLGISGSKEGVN